MAFLYSEINSEQNLKFVGCFFSPIFMFLSHSQLMRESASSCVHGVVRVRPTPMKDKHLI